MEYNTNELSRLLDVSTNTIRRYEKMGYLSADRNEQNGYRKFSHADVEKLMYVAKYRKVEFSHEEIADILNEDRKAIVKRFETRKEEIDAQIRHLQAVSHMLKDDIMLMHRVEEYGSDVIELECSPFYYVLYQKRGKLCGPGIYAEKLHHFMSKCIEFEYLYLFEQQDVLDGKMIYSEGVGAHKHRTEKYNIDVSAPVEFYERRPCILQFMRVPLDFRGAADADPEGLYQQLFGDLLKYMEEHNMEACGDALALKLGYSKEENQKWQYILLHLPVVQK